MRASAHRKRVVAGGRLGCALIPVVLFTSPGVFRILGPIAVMVRMGSAAVLAQSIRPGTDRRLARPVLCLHRLRLFFCEWALFPGACHLGMGLVRTLALAPLGSFAIRNTITRHSFRKQPAKPE